MISLTNGRSYFFECSKPGFASDSILWYKGSVQVTTDSNARVHTARGNNDEGMLVINSFNGTVDSATYRCEAGQGSGSFMITSGESCD